MIFWPYLVSSVDTTLHLHMAFPWEEDSTVKVHQPYHSTCSLIQWSDGRTITRTLCHDVWILTGRALSCCDTMIFCSCWKGLICGQHTHRETCIGTDRLLIACAVLCVVEKAQLRKLVTIQWGGSARFCNRYGLCGWCRFEWQPRGVFCDLHWFLPTLHMAFDLHPADINSAMCLTSWKGIEAK